MPDYTVGTVQIAGATSTLIIQDCQVNIEFDSAEVKDEKGNVLYIKHYNHRAVFSFNAVAAHNVSQPCPGMSISIYGVTLPTITSSGAVSGGITISNATTPSGTSVKALITSANLSTSNSDVAKYSCTATRYMENGLGKIRTSSSDSLS